MATINGTNFNDTLTGTSGPDIINGLDGSDEIHGGGGDDLIDGGAGADIIYGDDGNDIIHAGSSQGDFLFGDIIFDGPGNDVVYGEGDHDLFVASPGDDYYDGGTGGTVQAFEDDVVSYVGASAGIVVDMRLSSAQVRSAGAVDAADIGVDTLVNIEEIYGTAFDDLLFAGSDFISLYGGDGNDHLVGGPGGDLLDGGAGDDIIEGGTGLDLVSYASSPNGVTVSLAIAGPQDTGYGFDTLSGVEELIGSNYADHLTGDANDNILRGGLGDNVLLGGAGNDVLYGEGGADILEGGDGNDSIHAVRSEVIIFRAGDDQDQIFALRPTNEVRIFGYVSAQSIVQVGGDVLVTLSAGDSILFRNRTIAAVVPTLHFMGTSGDDAMVGTDGVDRLSGGEGNDTISGYGGNDILAGDSGADTIDGGDGADSLYSGSVSPAWSAPGNPLNPYVAPILDHGAEVDTLIGGAGLDTIYAGFGDNVDGGQDLADLLISFAGATSGVTIDFRSLDNGGTLIAGGGLIQNIRAVRWIEGTNFNDTIIAGDGHDLGPGAPIFGLGGDDHIVGGQSTGNIYGGDGNDTIELNQSYAGGPSNNYLFGDAGDDVITVTGDGVSFPLATAFGGDGNDILTLAGSISGGAGNDTINVAFNTYYQTSARGDEGDDTITDSDASDTLYGGDGADVIDGNGGNDLIASAGMETSAGWDLVDRDSEHDVVRGGSGDDTIWAGYGDDVDGGTGNNSLNLSLLGATSGVVLNVADLQTGAPYLLGGGTIQNIQTVASLWGSNFNDMLTLAGAATVYGMDGDDTITGSAGADQIHGGAGADIINAGDGNDLIYVDGELDLVPGEQVHGGAGVDTLIDAADGSFDDEYLSLAGVTLDSIEILQTRGGTGFGINQAVIDAVSTLDGRFQFVDSGAISLAGKSAPFSASFALNAAGNILDMTGFTFNGILQVAGSDAADTIIGTALSDNIFGNGGNDIVRGGAGNDNLLGGDGDDLLDGGAGLDAMAGGAGNDIYIVDSETFVHEDAGRGTDTVQSSISFALSSNVENLVLTGSSGTSGTGNALANVIVGNAGSNTISGGSGADTLTGGAGNDTFKDTAAGLNGDTITDFGVGDRIVVSDASVGNFSFTFANNVLTFGGSSVTLQGVPPGASIVVRAAAEGGTEITIQPQFGAGILALPAFGFSADAGGWQSNDRYPRMLADVNGDGRADIVGFGEAGALVALANGAGGFSNPFLARGEFGASSSAGGWLSNDRYPRELADVNGDGRADIVGFGENGVFVALARTDGTFAAAILAVSQFGAAAGAGGWASNDRFPRLMADVNGDGRADIVGFGDGGVFVSLARADGTFAPAFLAAAAFGSGSAAGGWASNDRYPRMLVDVNGDHRADIVGFGENGVFVALANTDGTFQAARLASSEFGAGASAGGWASNDRFLREVADVDGDGRADIVGYGDGGVYIALGRGDGTFQASVHDVNAFGSGSAGGGWFSQDHFPRFLADINHDGAADIVGFGNAGVYVALSNGDIWS